MTIRTDKIFCIGLSRTGTTALSYALESMGIKTLHYSIEIFLDYTKRKNIHFLELPRYWERARYREMMSFPNRSVENILEGYQAAADLPFPIMFRELNEIYPDAKFIYTYRNLEDWLESMLWLINEGCVFWNQGLLDKEIFYQVYGTVGYDKAILSQVFKQHHEEVMTFFGDNRNFLSLNIDKGELDYAVLSAFTDSERKRGRVTQINQRKKLGLAGKTLYRIKWSSPLGHSLARVLRIPKLVVGSRSNSKS